MAVKVGYFIYDLYSVANLADKFTKQAITYFIYFILQELNAFFIILFLLLETGTLLASILSDLHNFQSSILQDPSPLVPSTLYQSLIFFSLVKLTYSCCTFLRSYLINIYNLNYYTNFKYLFPTCHSNMFYLF